MSQFARVPSGSGKITLGTIDGPHEEVEAQFNPKELQVDRTVPWSPTGETNNTNGGAQQSSNNSGINLQFTGAQGRTLTLELLFDGYEKRGFSVNVADQVSKLEKMASVIKPGSTIEGERNPPRLVANWGTTLRAFRCVIESLSTKYTMFDAVGTPLRAICTVKLKEVDRVGAKPKDAPAGGSNSSTPSTGGQRT